MSESDTVPTGSTAEHIVECPATSTAKDVSEDPTTSTAEDIIDTPTGTSTAGDIIEHPVASTEADILEDPVTSAAEDTIENPPTYTAEDILENTTAVYMPGDIFKIGGVSSQFGGRETFDEGQPFVNVKGSSRDQKIGNKSWLRMWKDAFGVKHDQELQCSSYGYGKTPEGTSTRFACTKTIVGGHVIKGKEPSKVPHGSNDVYIIPICQKHNKNENIQMSAVTSKCHAVRLDNYHNP
ncbi:hypothetical protein C8Q76DRAFT_73217 [Earliella scabrosa]|nr:hypothetical protein C8Q76DRAFT_73217 [Earliella scabrosa]